MNNNGWIIGVDLDGTLVRGREYEGNHKVSELTKDVLIEMYNQGHIICIDTGRGHHASKGVYETIGLPTPSINHAGAHIHNPSDESFEQIISPINDEILKEIIFDNEYSTKIAVLSLDAPYRSYYQSAKYPELKDALVASGARTYPDDSMPNIGDVEFTAANIVYETNEEGINEIINSLEEKYGDQIHIVPWISKSALNLGLCGIEINVESMSKGKALLALAERLGIPHDRTMGIGDSPNDRDLMITPKIGVAMKNAEQEILDLADEVTEFTNTEEGVAKYLIKKFNLNIKY